MPVTPTTPATLLDCVNMLLLGIRQAPIGSLLQVDTNVDAEQAQNTINQANREFQMEGWFFNTTYEKAIDPDVDDRVTLPVNTLKVIKSRYKSGKRLTQRGGYLFDPKDGVGFEIGETVYVDLVECLDFDDLSEAARMFVTGKAAQRFCLPKLPERSTQQWISDFVSEGRARVEQEEAEQEDGTLSETSPHFAKHQQGKKAR